MVAMHLSAKRLFQTAVAILSILSFASRALLAAEAPAGERKGGEAQGGEGRTLDQMDELLNRLEERLKDREREYLTSGERDALESDRDSQVLNSLGGHDLVRGAVPAADELQKISADIVELEADLEKISDQITKAKQSVVEDLDNSKHVDLVLKLDDALDYRLSSLSVKIDGIEIYSIRKDQLGFVPEAGIPIYYGPLAAQAHQLQVQASLRSKGKSLKDVVNEQTRDLNETYELALSPESKPNVRYEVMIRPHAGDPTSLKAELGQTFQDEK